MKMNRFQSDLFYKVTPYFTSILKDDFKELLETKHLYQNYHVSEPDKKIVEAKMKELLSGVTDQSPDIKNTVDFVHSSFASIEWDIINPSDRKLGYYDSDSSETDQSLRFKPPSLKLYCSKCKRTEAYNFLYGFDLLEKSRDFLDKAHEQVFSLTYQCQSCKGTPEVFIVYRYNLKLIQSGRSPMEEFDIPKYIPKSHRKYFSDAIIAYNSGQVLAGNFLLRTFIEQYVRSQVSRSESQEIDTIFNEYRDNLHEDFNRHFPSLYSIYSSLSSDIHSALGSEEVFLDSKRDVKTHFKAKEAFSERRST